MQIVGFPMWRLIYCKPNEQLFSNRSRRVHKLFQKTVDYLQNKLDSNWTIDIEMDVSADLREQVNILRDIVGSDKMEVGYILPYLRSAGRCHYKNTPMQLIYRDFL